MKENHAQFCTIQILRIGSRVTPSLEPSGHWSKTTLRLYLTSCISDIQAVCPLYVPCKAAGQRSMPRTAGTNLRIESSSTGSSDLSTVIDSLLALAYQSLRSRNRMCNMSNVATAGTGGCINCPHPPRHPSTSTTTPRRRGSTREPRRCSACCRPRSASATSSHRPHAMMIRVGVLR